MMSPVYTRYVRGDRRGHTMTRWCAWFDVPGCFACSQTTWTQNTLGKLMIAAALPIGGCILVFRKLLLGALLIGLSFAAGHAFAASVPKMATPTLTGGERQISLTWSHPQGVTGLQAYRIRYREKGQSAWTYADAKADDGEQNFEGHVTSATIPANETFAMKTGTTYQVEIRAGKWDGGYDGWGAWSDTAEATTVAVTLTVSAVTLTGATLTIGNHTGNWHYKYSRPVGGRCSSAVSTASTTVGGLKVNTSYTFKAYSDGNCSSELAAASAFPTMPPKASKPTVTALPSGALSIRSTVTGDATLTRWEYKKKDDTWDANWTAVNRTWSPFVHVVGDLTDGTSYQFKVRAVNATGTGAESDPSNAASPSTGTVTVSNVGATTATLTLTWDRGEFAFRSYISRSVPHKTCQSLSQSTSSISWQNLQPNTNYTYTLHNYLNCNHKLVTAPKFLTKPGKPTRPTAKAGAGSGKLTLAASLPGGGGALTKWEYTRDDGATWTDIPNSKSKNLSYTVTGLTDGTDYTFKVRATNATGTGAESDASTAAQPKDETLAASAVGATTATLRIGNYTGNWYYKYTAPSGGSCSTDAVTGASVDLSDLTPGTSYTFKAYSDSGCSTELAAASAFLTKPARTMGVTITTLSGKLDVSWTEVPSATHYKVQWKSGNQNYHNDRRTPVNSGTKHTIPSLTNDTEYTLQVAAVNRTGDGAWSAETKGTPGAVTLTASKITRTSATLTLANYAGGWSYKSTAAHSPCNAIADGTTEVSLTELTAGTEYTYAAFSSLTCGPTAAEIGRETFTTPAAATLTASDVGADLAKLTIGNHSGNWYYKANAAPDNSCKGPVSGTTKNLRDLTTATSYTYKAYSDSSCNTEITSASTDAEFLTKPGKTMDVSADPGDTEIDVSWTAATGAASYKVQWKSGNENYDDTTRQATPTSASHTITGLTNDTEYTLRVAAVNDTGDGEWSDEAGATPKAVTLTATNVAQTTATLKIAGYTKAWAFSRTDNPACTAVAARTSEKNVTGLTKNTEYTYHAFSGAQCVTSLQIAEHTFTTLDSVTLTASLTGANTATLTIANYTPNWYYKADAAPDSTCKGPVSGATKNLTNLAGNTNYTYKAYSDSSCSTTALASASAFLTKPGKPTTPTATSGVGSGKLTLSALVTGDGPGGGTSGEVSRWEYQQKSESDSDSSFGSWTEISSTSNTLSYTVTGLTDGTKYQFKVRAVNPTGTGAASNASTAKAPVDGIPSFDNNIADQTYVKDKAIATLTLPEATGGDAPLTYSLAPDLPDGLTFDGRTRVISGTPTELQAETTYTYTVTDDDDDTAALNFKLTVVESASVEVPAGDGADSAPGFGSQTIADETWLQGLVIEPLVLPQASGGNGVLSYTLTPALPAGLTFDAATRTLGGTPREASESRTYTYTVTDADGDRASLTFTIAVAANLTPDFGDVTGVTIADQVYIQNTPIGPLALPQASGGNGVLSYTLTPALPAGLTFDAATRTLGGTPREASESRTYTYTVTDADGDRASLTFTIAVTANLTPDFGGVTINNRTYQQNAVIEPAVLPAASGGDGTLTYALSPALPSGLSFDAATRTLSGTPTAAAVPSTYTYTATDANGDHASLTFTLKVVISAEEKATLQDGLAAQGRALLSGATGVIGERFRNPGASSRAEAGLAACLGETGPGTAGTDDAGGAEPECATGLLTTVAQAMLGMSGAGGRADPWGMADADDSRLRGPGLGNGGAQPAWDWESLIWGRSFALPLNAQGAPGSAWTLWGAGDIQGFEGSPRQGTYDGQVRSLYLGVDAQWQAQWLAGAALAQSWGETDYVAEPGGSAGQLETTLTSIYPYVRGTLGSGLEVWAIGGYGRGEAEQTQRAAGDTRDLTMAMGATGVRQPMTEVGGAQVALVGGAGYLSLATEDGPAAIADLDVAVNRARLAVEAAWTAGGLAPYIQVGGRYDGGAGQTGAGLETVAGVRYTSERLEFEARGRWLATHAADGYAEYGGLARLAVKPQADGTGFRMAVAPRWGAADGAGLLGGGAVLLDGGALPGLGVSGIQAATNQVLAVESELGYGFAVFDRQGVLTPYGGFALTGEETRQYRLGARLGVAQWLNLSLEGSRRETTGQQPADQGVQLTLQGRF